MLVARIATSTCAIPIEHVIETMRPPSSEDGVAVHRGDRLPVIDGARLLGAASAPRRCVVMRAGGGRAGVLVDEVLGVQRVARVAALPALFAALDAVPAELRGALAAIRVMP